MYEDFRKRMERKGSFMGETMRRQSDAIVNATWLNSVAARRVQVKWLNYGLPPEYASATDFEDPIDAHFELKSAYSVNSGETPYYLTFRPGELTRHPEIQVGAYVCIPNVDDIPEWWLIIFIEDDNELKKVQILKCNWTLKWIADGKIYSTLGCQRYISGNSSGESSGSRITTVSNITSFFVPTNNDTMTINYDHRFLISDTRRLAPLCYGVSKIEDTVPAGLTKVQMEQEQFNPNTDSAELMIANYYNSNVEPVVPDIETELLGTATITYSGVNATIRVGGSYKTFTAAFSGENVTVDKWLISDENGDISNDAENYTIEYSDTQMRLKVSANYYLIKKVLIIQVIGTDGSTAETRVEVVG